MDGVTFATTGDRVLVLGAARALFEAAAGLREVQRGRLEVLGLSPRDALREAEVASAPLDPPLPARWTVREYLGWCARLAGRGRADAAVLADAALERLQLGSNAGSRLGATGVSLRRALVVAGALATGARALLLDDPLAGLPDDAARALARVLSRALEGCRSAVFTGRMALESPLALVADEAIVIAGATVVAQGAPAELAAAERTLALRVDGDVAQFAAAVDGLGGRAVVTAGATSPVHVRVELGPLSARDLLRLAADARAVVLELRPIGLAFG